MYDLANQNQAEHMFDLITYARIQARSPCTSTHLASTRYDQYSKHCHACIHNIGAGSIFKALPRAHQAATRYDQYSKHCHAKRVFMCRWSPMKCELRSLMTVRGDVNDLRSWWKSSSVECLAGVNPYPKRYMSKMTARRRRSRRRRVCLGYVEEDEV